ncbi:MFS transporter [Stackebrandtia nassauensis]|uniref:Major facilitator superfamily MFS_1 n=1 Tax=Stackebrandtia nassauensis (strain DSM 44728 / CIP 108903 / NRRL B-16338 / NBRC 102104 / LLR-40K-21) TaxID=446470 RepID=D3Q691_STANL|nr:MFS transporter [Stackebrandtia nassauensis]ADD42266.1 major facilitator superfamily MFS_1 [Stackebrandtia nassauensis DSM 44728]
MAVASPTAPQTRSRAVLPIACAAIVPVLMNYTSPLISLPETAAGVGAGPLAQTWIMNASPLGLAAALLVAGILADNFGRRRMLLVGALGMGLTSAIVALSTDAAVLIGARIGQGVAGAAIIAASLGLLGSNYTDPAERGRATGLWAMALGAGLAVGPLATGALTEAWSWRAIYWVYAAVSIALAVAVTRLDESRAEQRRPVHYAGIVSFVSGMCFLLAAITLARTGWTRLPVLVLLGATVVALAGFVALSLRHHAPMVDMRLFRHRPFLLSVTGSGLNGLLMIGVMSVLPTAWQHTHHFDALHMAIPFTVYPLAALVIARLARYVPVPPIRLLAIGYGLSLAQLLMVGSMTNWSMPRVVISYLIAGIGAGFVNAANARMAVDSVPSANASMGSGAANTARYVGSAMGVAIGIAVVGGLGWADGVNSVLIGSAVLLGLAALGYASVGRVRRPSLA